MKVVILAGGLGTRLSEETVLKPKPMVEIGEKPILWHIMNLYSYFGVNEFIICCGYKGHVIKEFFTHYFMRMSDLEIDMASGVTNFINREESSWNIKLIDTGLHTMTGGRLKRVSMYLDQNEPFCFTYGDGLANINIRKLINFHRNHKKMATVTAVNPTGRFGALEIENSNVINFREKQTEHGNLINGGFFVLDPSVVDLLDDDTTIWEQEPLKQLAIKNELVAYNHKGFWQPMDSLKDKHILQKLWDKGDAPWTIVLDN